MRLNNGLWLFGDRVTLNAFYGTTWNLREIGLVDAHTNGWRFGDRCLSATLRLGRLSLNVVFWHMPFARKNGAQS